MRPLLVSLFATLAFASAHVHAATTTRTFASAQSFSINGVECPEVESWSGGDISATVALGIASPGSATKKHISQVGIEPIVVTAVPPLSPALTACLADLCAGRSTPVTLLLSGSDPKPLQAANATLIETQFPALDGASKEAYEIIFIFRAESVQPSATPARTGVAAAKTKRALASNFQFTLGSLDTTRVASIAPFTIKRPQPANAVGVFRETTAQTAPTEFSDLAVVVSNAGAASWTAWRDDFLIRGNRTDAQELNGSLTLLGPDMKAPLLTLQFSHVGIIRFAHNPSMNESSMRSTASLYCEQIIVASPATTPVPAPTTNPPPSTTPAKDTTNTNDAGLRDPKGFPRPAGLTRTTYSKTDSDSRLSESAGYSSEQDVDAVLESYVKVLEGDGWKKDSLNESGSTRTDHMIMSYWRKDKMQADLRLYGAKAGSTVYLSLTTEK